MCRLPRERASSIAPRGRRHIPPLREAFTTHTTCTTYTERRLPSTCSTCATCSACIEINHLEDSLQVVEVVEVFPKRSSRPPPTRCNGNSISASLYTLLLSERFTTSITSTTCIYLLAIPCFSRILEQVE